MLQSPQRGTLGVPLVVRLHGALHRRVCACPAYVCLTNLVALNFAYDVPVKLFSTHLLVMAAFVVAPEAPLLVRALAPPTATKPSFITRICTLIVAMAVAAWGLSWRSGTLRVPRVLR